jgi:hypothetical protein
MPEQRTKGQLIAELWAEEEDIFISEGIGSDRCALARSEIQNLAASIDRAIAAELEKRMLEEVHPTPWRIEGDRYNVHVMDANGKMIFGHSSDEGQLAGEDRDAFLEEMVQRVNAGKQ